MELPPELVLLLFLPALLYWESLNTSLREIRDNLRIIAEATETRTPPTADRRGRSEVATRSRRDQYQPCELKESHAPHGVP